MNNRYDDPAQAVVVKRLKAELFRLKDAVGDSDDRYPALKRLLDQERPSN
jgi:hypothetical protein